MMEFATTATKISFAVKNVMKILLTPMEMESVTTMAQNMEEDFAAVITNSRG